MTNCVWLQKLQNFVGPHAQRAAGVRMNDVMSVIDDDDANVWQCKHQLCLQLKVLSSTLSIHFISIDSMNWYSFVDFESGWNRSVSNTIICTHLWRTLNFSASSRPRAINQSNIDDSISKIGVLCVCWCVFFPLLFAFANKFCIARLFLLGTCHSL